MKGDVLTAAIHLARKAPYDEDAKDEWLRKGRAVARRLAKDLALPKGTYEVRANPGGIAVSGEIILHHERIYVVLSGFAGDDAGYMRTCSGREDYLGGPNEPAPDTYPALLAAAESLLRRGWWASLREGDVVWTDYPFVELGEVPGAKALWKAVTFLSYDRNKYARVRLSNGSEVEVKVGYLFATAEEGHRVLYGETL